MVRTRDRKRGYVYPIMKIMYIFCVGLRTTRAVIRTRCVCKYFRRLYNDDLRELQIFRNLVRNLYRGKISSPSVSQLDIFVSYSIRLASPTKQKTIAAVRVYYINTSVPAHELCLVANYQQCRSEGGAS